MRYPNSITNRPSLDPKLGIKSSLDNLKSVIALIYLLYIVNKRKSKIEYSEIDSYGNIKLKNQYLNEIKNYLQIYDQNIDIIINSNPLIKNQIEPLFVGISLLFRFGIIENDGSSERTSGVRKPKTIKFASNIILLDLLLQGFEDTVLRQCLWNWLSNQKSKTPQFEERVQSFISICIQHTICKLRKDDGKELYFNTEGIYKALASSNNAEDSNISIIDNKESVGPTRIYRNILKEDLDPWLQINTSNKLIELSSFKLFNELDAFNYTDIIATTLDLNNVEVPIRDVTTTTERVVHTSNNEFSNNIAYYNILKTKPFLLLAGISGTGKSRIVREFAFKSCPKELQEESMTTPGNYCMIEVKPNWHDSTELLGYWSNINKRYMFTKFVKFLVKAMQYPEVPFFVCLDEMNLAPVEQYFAEFLSVLETRQWDVDVDGKHIVTGSLVGAEYFRKFEEKTVKMSDREWYEKLYEIKLEGEELEEDKTYRLYEEGLPLPENVFIVGTVNMDDTTHQFSRKVIDRAMTIEMNGGNLSDIFMGKDDLTYVENPMTMADMKVKYLTAIDVVENCEVLKNRQDLKGYVTGEEPLDDETLPKRLDEINNVLRGTPFTVSYRVMNELTIYLGVLLDEIAPTGMIEENTFKEAVNRAIDNILLMKILPRVEGDDEMFRLSDEELSASGLDGGFNNTGFEYTKLDWLKRIALQQGMEGDEDGEKEKVYGSVDKLDEMIERLHRQNFTRFWP